MIFRHFIQELVLQGLAKRSVQDLVQEPVSPRHPLEIVGNVFLLDVGGLGEVALKLFQAVRNCQLDSPPSSRRIPKTVLCCITFRLVKVSCDSCLTSGPHLDRGAPESIAVAENDS